jgi:hypothetical protein
MSKSNKNASKPVGKGEDTGIEALLDQIEQSVYALNTVQQLPQTFRLLDRTVSKSARNLDKKTIKKLIRIIVHALEMHHADPQ